MGTLSRVFVPVLIISVPVAAMMAYLTYYLYEKNRIPPAPDVTETHVPTVAFGSATWPIFRGDAGLTGMAEGGLPDSLRPVWRFETRAEIKSTPVVVDGTVFFTSMDRLLYAVDLKSGKERWLYRANDEIEASPLYADDRVFFASVIGTFFAVDAQDGLKVWTFEAGDRILGSANTYIAPPHRPAPTTPSSSAARTALSMPSHHSVEQQYSVSRMAGLVR
ncbi:MAG: PQQ-like beta-propeller repeat protein [Phycisphaerae bacterium]|jgi:hypothetical protein|nr:PQQ-like beta-propeller repeat protein [Phycisphaerae bacterium]